MYLTNEGHTYYHGTSQHQSRAPFLILVQHKDLPIGPDNFRALVRKVALQQMGHWMMGVARIKGQSITVSGDYGSDGLPHTTDITEVWEAATPVPKELYDLWNDGGGNSCGSEADAMRKWALENLM